MPQSPTTMLQRLFIACMLSLAALPAFADKVPLSDEQLGDVAGKGVAILVHLELNSALLSGQNVDSRLSAGFQVDGTTTYAIAQNFGGILDLFAVTLDPRTKPDGTGYLSIGMPYFVGAKEFGVRAIGVQTDLNAPVASSLGSLLLNGTANMTGSLNLWAK
jgi:hypothetical protein